MGACRWCQRTQSRNDYQNCGGGAWYIGLSEEEMVKTLGVNLDKNVDL